MERKIVWAEAEIWDAGGEISVSGVLNDFFRSTKTFLEPYLVKKN